MLLFMLFLKINSCLAWLINKNCLNLFTTSQPRILILIENKLNLLKKNSKDSSQNLTKKLKKFSPLMLKKNKRFMSMKLNKIVLKNISEIMMIQLKNFHLRARKPKNKFLKSTKSYNNIKRTNSPNFMNQRRNHLKVNKK